MAGKNNDSDDDFVDDFDQDTIGLEALDGRVAGDGDPAGPQNSHLVLVFGSSIGKVFALDKNPTVIGRSTKAHICIADQAVSRHHMSLVQAGADWLIVDQGSSNGCFVNDQRVERPTLLKHNDVLRLGANSALKFVAPDGPDAAHTLELYSAASTDFLTGVSNRRSLDDTMVIELSFSRRHTTPLAVMLMDLDHFKNVNDTYGHQIGDQVLQEFANVVRESIRAEDHFGRYGGEEFTIIARATGLEGAVIKAERIRAMVEAHPFVDGTVPVTVSIGVSGIPGGATKISPQAMLEAADNALYEAKEGGRNRVVSVNLESEASVSAPAANSTDASDAPET